MPAILRVRTLASSRDFVDVRDAALAIRLIVDSYRAGEIYNIASEHSVSLKEIATELSRLCPRPYTVTESHPVLQSSNPISQCGSYKKIADTYGWQPHIPWQRSLKEIWDEWDNTDP